MHYMSIWTGSFQLITCDVISNYLYYLPVLTLNSHIFHYPKSFLMDDNFVLLYSVWRSKVSMLLWVYTSVNFGNENEN